MFSSRTNWSRTLNPLTIALDKRRGQGLPVIDLTESNPTAAGFHYDQSAILRAMADPAAMKYQPHPRGLRSARDAVADYYTSSGTRVDAEQIILTTGTSEAYSYAMRLLAELGDEILCPAPSYPLFDFLADLNDVKLVHYPLAYDDGWRIDLECLASLISSRSRAIIIVNPNNPTGSYLRSNELEALAAIARSNGLALVVDEVFRDYAWAMEPAANSDLVTSTAEINSCLTLTFNGLSKLSALPQMKLAWIAVSGPEAEKAEALNRLEVIGDTYLSVGTPVQHAAGALLREGAAMRQQILARIRENAVTVDRVLSRGTPLGRLKADGGWYAVLRVPSIRSDEDWAIGMLEQEGVYLHPGDFFGFPQDGYLVISLLPEPCSFEEGIEKIVDHVMRIC